jgi:hypothetical protein
VAEQKIHLHSAQKREAMPPSFDGNEGVKGRKVTERGRRNKPYSTRQERSKEKAAPSIRSLKPEQGKQPPTLAWRPAELSSESPESDQTSFTATSSPGQSPESALVRRASVLYGPSEILGQAPNDPFLSYPSPSKPGLDELVHFGESLP